MGVLIFDICLSNLFSMVCGTAAKVREGVDSSKDDVFDYEMFEI